MGINRSGCEVVSGITRSSDNYIEVMYLKDGSQCWPLAKGALLLVMILLLLFKL